MYSEYLEYQFHCMPTEPIQQVDESLTPDDYIEPEHDLRSLGEVDEVDNFTEDFSD